MAATPEHAARVLGLDDQATLESVRDVRRKMALKYHPDCSDDVERATRHMARINAAADLLIAHIKALGTKAKQPSYSDFSSQYKSRRTATPKPEAPKSAGAKATEKRTKDDRANAPHAPAQQVINLTQPESGMSSKDRELIRFAVKSYRSVLDQISKADRGPRIDATALAYPAPA